jgi:hypothetical protein
MTTRPYRVMMTWQQNVAANNEPPRFETHVATETVWATGPPTARVKARHRYGNAITITNVHLPVEWANVDFSSMADMPIIPRA